MKKRKTAAFLAALMICAWVPQAVPGRLRRSCGRGPQRPVQTGTAATGTIKIRADWAATTITAAAIRPICTKTASAPMHPMWRRLLQRLLQRRRLRRRRRIFTWSLIPSTTRITTRTFTRPLDMIQTSSRSTSSPAA